MKYTNSNLVDYKKISPNKTKNRNHIIDTITIHCMAGNLTVEQCGNVFQTKKASSNYGIGTDGRIALYVDEKDRSWASSNSSNDNRAVTIEVANDGDAKTGWHVSDKAMASLIKLCADICKRNGIKELKWKADKKLIGQVDKQNMTVHRWFASKSCPGDYLFNKHGYIAQEVNKILKSNTTTTKPADKTGVAYLINGVDFSPVFDPTYYGKNNQDVVNVIGSAPAILWNHFCNCGAKEGRVASAEFNVKKYKAKYPDLQKQFGNDYVQYFVHYCKVGKAEGRTGK